MPEFKPLNIGQNLILGNDYDRRYYQASDKDYKRRHAPMVQAEKIFEGQTLKDQQGDSELMPALQNEFQRAGIGQALSSFGGDPSVLTPGSGGEASVARNLGSSIMGYQDRNRRNRMESLLTAESIFPRRTFGLSGQDVVNLNMQNAMNENNYNQAKYSNQVQEQQYNTQESAQGQAADAQKKQAMIAGGAAILGTVAIIF